MTTQTNTATARTGNFVFCYGSLRPDDDSGQPWTRSAIEGLQAQRAWVPHAKLYYDEYACMVLLHEEEEGGGGGVHGWVLSHPHDDFFRSKLQLFDEIEGIHPTQPELGLYQKALAVAELLLPDAIGNHPIGAVGEKLQVVCYHRSNCDRSILIPSGDWLQRPRWNFVV
eukprot:scaffold2033_cov164-Amphora_coffeaeformis.AAC.24